MLCMFFPFCSLRPPIFIASSTLPVPWAQYTCLHVGSDAFSERKAAREFLSVVFWLNIVRTNESSTGTTASPRVGEP